MDTKVESKNTLLSDTLKEFIGLFIVSKRFALKNRSMDLNPMHNKCRKSQYRRNAETFTFNCDQTLTGQFRQCTAIMQPGIWFVSPTKPL